MKRIYLLAYITILCCLCPLLKAQLGPMPFTPVPPNDPSLVRLLNSDVRCRQWVDSVMQRLTLKERIGQLFIYTIAPQQDKANKELLRKVVEDYKVGGLLFSGGLMQNQVMLTNEAQRMAEVPLMITFDGEWGLAMRLRGTPNFPRNMVLGCIQNDTLIYEYGREVARQCRELGVQVNFAPVADVNINPKNPVINTRSFGESPFNVANKVVAYSKGLEDGGVLSVSKHFPGHGDTDVDSHKALPVLPFTRARLDSIELYPFRKAIRAGLGGMMVGHLEVPTIEPQKGINHDVAKYVPETDYVVKVIDRHVEKAKHNLKGAPIVIAGGYGMGSKEGFDMLFELAKELHAEVGASRAAVDAGYADHDRQIGQTGVTVRPKLYIACGISGQIQHIAGMQESGIIISINNDENAPINTIADYVINGTVEEVIPKMIKYYKSHSK